MTDEVLFREKQSMPWYFQVLLFAVVIWALGSSIHASVALGKPWTMVDVWLPRVIGLLLLAVHALFFSMETSVYRDRVHVEWGYLRFFHQNIPLTPATVAEAVTYSPLRDFGGWGIRRGRDGTFCFNMRGNRGVMITEGSRRTLIGSQRPEELAEILAKAIRPHT